MCVYASSRITGEYHGGLLHFPRTAFRATNLQRMKDEDPEYKHTCIVYSHGERVDIKSASNLNIATAICMRRLKFKSPWRIPRYGACRVQRHIGLTAVWRKCMWKSTRAALYKQIGTEIFIVHSSPAHVLWYSRGNPTDGRASLHRSYLIETQHLVSECLYKSRFRLFSRGAVFQ